MSFLTRLFGKKKKELNIEVTKLNSPDNPSCEIAQSGTTIRKNKNPLDREATDNHFADTEPDEKPLWKVKQLPVWEPRALILDTYEVEDVMSGGMGHPCILVQ